MKENIIVGANEVTMFCRLQMNVKKDIPIRPSEMGVLIYIKNRQNVVTPLEISNYFSISKPSVTAMVNSLIKKDYLIKKPSSTDGRSYTVSLTDKGNDLVKTTYNEYFRTMELLEEKMGSKEFEVLINLIKRANKILSEEK